MTESFYCQYWHKGEEAQDTHAENRRGWDIDLAENIRSLDADMTDTWMTRGVDCSEIP